MAEYAVRATGAAAALKIAALFAAGGGAFDALTAASALAARGAAFQPTSFLGPLAAVVLGEVAFAADVAGLLLLRWALFGAAARHLPVFHAGVKALQLACAGKRVLVAAAALGGEHAETAEIIFRLGFVRGHDG